jgi:hypothetical protein
MSDVDYSERFREEGRKEMSCHGESRGRDVIGSRDDFSVVQAKPCPHITMRSPAAGSP